MTIPYLRSVSSPIPKVLVALLLIPVLAVLLLEVSFRLFNLLPPAAESVTLESIQVDSVWRSIGPNRYRQHTSGIWEAYIEGAAYERGLTLGELAKAQVREQEEHFIAQIRKLVPSKVLLRTLKYGVSFFNRNMDEHVPVEYQQEIHGISQAFDSANDWIAPPYARVMNYHAAHDIGHALQDLSIVGCTSFAAWDATSADSNLIIGRNFDFYMGDDFAKDKMVLFVRPDSGHAFASVTWAGFMGVVSGMNEHGLTVTLNAAKSDIPTASKTPISLLAREILQYARNIDEAYAIAQSRETFVSESILIGSAEDGKAVIIEKSPKAIGLFAPEGNALVCSNHYQSSTFRDDPVNLENIRMSDSEYRFQRMWQLLNAHRPIAPESAASILRNQKGLDDADLGMGNPKAINQLLAHHGVIFQPEKRLMWVSANPFQLGEFVCYDLKKELGDRSEEIETRHYERSEVNTLDDNEGLLRSARNDDTCALYLSSLNIPADTFLLSADYQDFLHFKATKQRIFDFLVFGRGTDLTSEEEVAFLASNPKSYITHQLLGELYLNRGNKLKAVEYFQSALGLQVASETEREWLSHKIQEAKQ